MNDRTTLAVQRLIPGILLLAVLLLLLRETAAEMVMIWINSKTFTHAFLVPPIVLWLAWRRRAVLAATPSAPVYWLLVPIALTCFLWLLGELASVGVASHFALVTLIVLSVPAMFGWAVARELTFPLAFLYFAVPFGAFTTPQLMEWTADFTVIGLRASGIPVYREGMQFVIPSGTWSVVEACSGVRYLIASLMVGTLFAYLNYRSTKRRVIFMVASLIVPVIANWLRAYMIVMIGHLSNNQLAVGVDHLIYGWVFFGIVIGALFFIGARWAEPDEVLTPPPHSATAAPLRSWPGLGVAAATLALVAGTQVWAWRIGHASQTGTEPVLLFPAASPAWTEVAQPLPWQPAFHNPNLSVTIARAQADRKVWLWAGYYRQQGVGRQLITSVNSIVGVEDKQWNVVEAGHRTASAELPAFRTAILRRGLQLAAATSTRLRVWQLYWVGGRWVAEDPEAKLLLAVDMLRGRGDDGAVLLLATPLTGSGVAEADAVLEQFVRGHLEAVGTALSQTRETR